MLIKILCIIGWLFISPLLSLVSSAIISSKIFKWKKDDLDKKSCTLLVMVTAFIAGIGIIIIALL